MSLKLALDTTSSSFSLALGNEKGLISEHSFLASSPSSRDSLVFELDNFLKKNAVLKSALSQVVVNYGPGSFSGIRAGLGVSLALKESLRVSVLALSGLYAQALRKDPGEKRVIVVLQHANSDQEYFIASKFIGSVAGEDIIESIIPPGLINKENLKLDIQKKLKFLNENYQDVIFIRRDENYSGENTSTSASLLLRISSNLGNIPRTFLNKNKLLEAGEEVKERLIPLYVNKLNALTLKERGLKI